MNWLTYVATFLSSWMLNKYNNRAKLHLISWIEGKDTSKLRGLGLFKALETQAKGKLVALQVWNTCGSTAWPTFIIRLYSCLWVILSMMYNDINCIMLLACGPWKTYCVLRDLASTKYINLSNIFEQNTTMILT